MTAFRFSRRSEARSNHKDGGRKSFRRTKEFHPAFEPLESRQMLSGSTVTTLTLNIPAAAAQQGIEAVLYDSKTNKYLDSTGNYVATPSGSGQLPYLTLVPASTSTLTQPVSVPLAIPYEGGDMKGGELIIFVGPVNTGVTYTNGTINAPSLPLTPTPQTITQVDNYAQLEFTYTAAAGLDVDPTTVDTSGYPFTIVSPSSANVAYPLGAVGITLSQDDLFGNFDAALSMGQYPSEFAMPVISRNSTRTPRNWSRRKTS